ncbi:signal peptidase I [Nocardioides marmorisolisilvae]|uniref:Signal peptidase I n=1 Tax=Nocardioides marmorisolisilvae TaxID=1542737 RepID=A0A3N0DUI3_9ACTN|nr:signal peptidase I [Nocardioides marmorisolisilvae]RNL79191.1 signal peptidase I [Nocardioides marmorisolisilvae]
MSLRTVRTVTGKAVALLVTGLVVVVLALAVVVPKLMGATSYTILTGSMRPKMPPGTLVVVKPVEPDQVRVGDVLTYQIESGKKAVATHRVERVEVTFSGTYSFIMKGDANQVADPSPVRPEQVRGKRVYAVPYLAYPSLLVDGDVRELVVMGSVVLLLGYALFSFAGAARDHRATRRRRTEPGTAARELEEVGS